MITYLPVSPVAPPNKITFVLLTYVIIWPKRANGTSPKVSTFATLEEVDAKVPTTPVGVVPCCVTPPPKDDVLEDPEKDAAIIIFDFYL